MKRLQSEPNHDVSIQYIQLGCLLLISLIEGITILFGDLFSVPLQFCITMLINMSGAMFLGTILTRPFVNKTARRLFFLGLCFCLYIGLLQLLEMHGQWMNKEYYPRYGRNSLFCEYMMLLPLAAMLDEKYRDRGLILHGICYLAAIFGYVILTAVIYLGGGGPIRQLVSLWYEARLSVIWNPNILGGILLVGLGMTLILFFKARHIGLKIFLGCFALGDYLMLCLTNSRACLIMASCILGGLVFFLIWNGTSRRFFLGFVAAILTIVLTYSGATTLFSVRMNYMVSHVAAVKAESAAAQEVLPKTTFGDETEAVAETKSADNRTEAEKAAAMAMSAAIGRESKEGTEEDYRTFNGRTEIWKGCLKALKEKPMVLFVGTPDVGELIRAQNKGLECAHAHNSWLEILLGSGILGLAFALTITWLAFRSSILLFFMKESTMDQKLVGLTVLAILGSQMFEPYLFCVRYPCIFLQIPFMLCLGYAVYWVQLLPNREKPRKSK